MISGFSGASNGVRKDHNKRNGRYCYHPYINWLLPAWVFYLIGALIYLVVDFLSAISANVTAVEYNVLFLVASVVYFIDSIFYFLAWLVMSLEARDFDDQPLEIDAAAWGEILYVWSALFGLISASCLFIVPYGGTYATLEAMSRLGIWLAYAFMLFASNTLYLVDALCYWTAWWNKRSLDRNPPIIFFDAYWWADGILLSLPSLGYFITSFVLMFELVAITQRAGTLAEAVTQFEQVIVIVRACNIFFDFMYVVDAIVYALGWLADSVVIRDQRLKRGQERDEEIQCLEEIQLGPSFRL